MGAFRWFALFFFIWLTCASAHAERRVALVIGNSAYKSVPKLANPVHDATLVADMFKQAGFDEVTAKLDLNANDMRRALRDFGARARDADVAVIYYAGHGMEMDGNNYLIPTDAVLETDADVLDETVQLDRVLFAVEPAKQLRLIILDACRDNPFAKTMKRTIASRGVGRGLAKVEPNTPNTMIAFAAKAGSTASDGDSENGPFAKALVDNLPKPGLDLRLAFGYVRDAVLKNTGHQQEPYVYGSLGGDKVSLVPALANPADTGPQPNPQDAIRKDYELALQLGTRDGWTAFLARYADGFYADLAKGQLNKIAAEEARAAAAEKARLAEQEKVRLAAEGAKRIEQEKAAAAAKVAEQARVAAEKTKQVEQTKAEAAEGARKAAEAAAAKAIAEKPSAGAQAAGEKIAALSPPAQPALSPADLAKSVQLELRRVGCLTGTTDGGWNAPSQRSLTLFNKYAGTKFDVKLASPDALDAIKAKPGRVCPLVCDHGFKADGDACVKITCKSGYQVGADNGCEKIERAGSTATREKPAREPREQGQSKPERQTQSTGQILCNAQGCKPVAKGCRIGSGGATDTNFARASGVMTCN